MREEIFSEELYENMKRKSLAGATYCFLNLNLQCQMTVRSSPRTCPRSSPGCSQYVILRTVPAERSTAIELFGRCYHSLLVLTSLRIALWTIIFVPEAHVPGKSASVTPRSRQLCLSLFPIGLLFVVPAIGVFQIRFQFGPGDQRLF